MNIRGLATWLARVAIYGGGAGTLVYLVIFGVEFDPRGLVWCLGAGLCYSTVMLTSIERTMMAFERRGPLRSRAAILPRVVVLSTVSLVSFLIATWIIEQVFGFRLFGAGSVFMLSAVVALAMTATASSIYFLQSYRSRLRAAEAAAVRAELQALRAQINPHFLFNALNSIAALIRIAPARAEEVTESLADLFRYSLHASSRPTVTLEEEVESVELYLTIERARYGERLDALVLLPPELRHTLVPSLTLQPLVENAVKHGVAQRDGPCRVVVEARAEAGSVVVSVSDDGPGFNQAELDQLCRRGHGLANVRDRLRLQFGESASMTLRQNAVDLSFPMHSVPHEEVHDADVLHR